MKETLLYLLRSKKLFNCKIEMLHTIISQLFFELIYFRFGSEKVKREFLAPSISGDMVACLGVSEPGGGK